MKKLAILAMSILALTACNQDDGGSQSTQTAAANNAAATSGNTAPGTSAAVAKTLSLVVSPQVNAISLSWGSIEGAESYTVYRLQPTVDVDPYSQSDLSQTAYAFSTLGAETYQVWVEAINSEGQAISQSQKVTVTAAAAGQKLALEEAP